jgi:hypothetical protein
VIESCRGGPTPGVFCRLEARSSPSAMPAPDELALRLLSIARQHHPTAVELRNNGNRARYYVPVPRGMHRCSGVLSLMRGPVAGPDASKIRLAGANGAGGRDRGACFRNPTMGPQKVSGSRVLTQKDQKEERITEKLLLCVKDGCDLARDGSQHHLCKTNGLSKGDESCLACGFG